MRKMFLLSFKRYADYLQNYRDVKRGILFLLLALLLQQALLFVNPCINAPFLCGCWGFLYLLKETIFSFFIMAFLRPSVALKNRDYLQTYIKASLYKPLFYGVLFFLAFLGFMLVPFFIFLGIFFPFVFFLKTCSDLLLLFFFDHKTDSLFLFFKKNVRFFFSQAYVLSVFSALRFFSFFLFFLFLSLNSFSDTCINNTFFVLYTLLIDPFFMAFLVVLYTKRIHEHITLYT